MRRRARLEVPPGWVHESVTCRDVGTALLPIRYASPVACTHLPMRSLLPDLHSLQIVKQRSPTYGHAANGHFSTLASDQGNPPGPQTRNAEMANQQNQNNERQNQQNQQNQQQDQNRQNQQGQQQQDQNQQDRQNQNQQQQQDNERNNNERNNERNRQQR